MPKINKSSAGYVHFQNTEYHCEDCYKFNDAGRACYEVRGTILPFGGCNTFVPGDGPPTGSTISQKLSQLEAGYVENKAGFGCKRCEYFLRENWDCRKVDKDSPGTDRGIISPQGCCNLWQKDATFGVIE